MSNSSVRETARRADLRTAAQDLRKAGAHAAEALGEAVESGKATGVEVGRDVVRSAREAIDTLSEHAPGAVRFARASATAAEDLGQRVRETRLPDIARTLGDIAARQPAAFVGCGVLAGFLIARFLPSSR
jgi:hypothetical protein